MRDKCGVDTFPIVFQLFFKTSFDLRGLSVSFITLGTANVTNKAFPVNAPVKCSHGDPVIIIIIIILSLLAISKKTGGVRPIAVGYVWRRLTATVACCHVKEASATLLAPRQLGFGIAGGAEAVVRAARRYIDNMIPG